MPNMNEIDNTNNLNKNIYIPQYPGGKNLSYSEGKIKNINNSDLIYDASTKPGSSGSPIFLKNTIEVIGIHKQGNQDKVENYGILIYSLIQELKSKMNIIQVKL